MAKFVIDAFSTYAKSFLVEAENVEEAQAILERMYEDGKISLNHWTHTKIDFEPAPDQDQLVPAYEARGEKPVNA